jgi:hypothetical protein
MLNEEVLYFNLNRKFICVVKVYILEAYNLEKTDSFSDSDPYLIVSMGKSKFNERDNY